MLTTPTRVAIGRSLHSCVAYKLKVSRNFSHAVLVFFAMAHAHETEKIKTGKLWWSKPKRTSDTTLAPLTADAQAGLKSRSASAISLPKFTKSQDDGDIMRKRAADRAALSSSSAPNIGLGSARWDIVCGEPACEPVADRALDYRPMTAFSVVPPITSTASPRLTDSQPPLTPWGAQPNDPFPWGPRPVAESSARFTE